MHPISRINYFLLASVSFFSFFLSEWTINFMQVFVRFIYCEDLCCPWILAIYSFSCMLGSLSQNLSLSFVTHVLLSIYITFPDIGYWYLVFQSCKPVNCLGMDVLFCPALCIILFFHVQQYTYTHTHTFFLTLQSWKTPRIVC